MKSMLSEVSLKEMCRHGNKQWGESSGEKNGDKEKDKTYKI